MNANQAIPFINSYTYGFCEKQGFTSGQTWKWSMEEMVRTTHCNAIVLPVCAWQEHTYSTAMDSDHPDVMGEEDVRAVCNEVLRHRIGLSYEAEAENVTPEEIISQILNAVIVP